MKTPSLTMGLVILSVHLGTTTAVLAQGNLTPPGPPAPTMKSLAQVEPRTPISSLPFTINNPGSYYLTANLTGVSPTNGITVAANNVSVDLNGFALVGATGSVNGITTRGSATNLIVRNGNISGWGQYGILASAASSPDSLCERLTIANCGNGGIWISGGTVSDCTIVSCAGNGIQIGTAGTISGCTILSCNGDGVFIEFGAISGCAIQSCSLTGIGAYLVNASRCTISSCNDGMSITRGSVSGCSVGFNTNDGISMLNGTVSGCDVTANGASGIAAGEGCLITGNNCLGNNTSANGSEAGITVSYGNNRIEENIVSASGVAGIAVNAVSSATNNVIIKNTVSGNGASNYVTPGTQVVGPIISTAGTITSSSPWANFSF